MRITRVFQLCFYFIFLSALFININADEFKIGCYYDPLSLHYYKHSDNDSLSTNEATAYFNDMSEFGIDFIVGVTAPQTVQYCESYGVKLIPYNWGGIGYAEQRITLSDSTPYLESIVHNGPWFEMEAEVSADTMGGYSFLTTGVTGATDATTRYALQGTNSEGFLFCEADSSVSYNMTHVGFRWDDIFIFRDQISGMDSLLYCRAHFVMKYDNPVRADSELVIGQIHVKNRDGDNFANDNLNPITLYDDTLLVDLNSASFSISDPSITLHVESGDTSSIYNIYGSYNCGRIDTNGVFWGTICDSYKDVKLKDFQTSANVYDTLSILFFKQYNAYTFYWYDSADVYIDKAFISNDISYNFATADSTCKSEWTDNINDLYTDSLGLSNADSVINKWMIYDEAYDGIWYMLKHARNVLKNSSECPNPKMITSRGAGGIAPFGFTQMSYIIEDAPDMFVQLGSFYSGCTPSLFSSTADSSVQVGIDFGIDRLMSFGEQARDPNYPLNFIPILYLGGCYTNDAGSNVCMAPASIGPEAKLQAYLAIAYGANEIAYWPYVTLPIDSDSLPAAGFSEVLDDYPSDKTNCETYASGEIDYSVRGFVIKDEQTGLYVRDTLSDAFNRWNAGKQTHSKLDLIASILNARSFDGAGRWDSLSGSSFDNITSEQFGDSAAFVQWAEFTDTTSSTSYYMLINRRIWPDAATAPNGLSDSQRVDFVINESLNGDYYGIDILTGDSIVLISGDDQTFGSVLLPPGEAVIFNLDSLIPYYWVESQESQVRYCPAGGTHNVIGDIYVDSTQQLIISEDNTFNILSGVDSASTSGADANKIEIIVEGEFHAIGTSETDKVVFTSSADSANSWYGIRVVGNGTADLQYATIENAYIGYKNTSTATSDVDTLKDVLIDNIYTYGAYISNGNVFVSDVDFKSEQNYSYGLYLKDADIDVQNCWFDNVYRGVWIDQGDPVFRNCTIDSGLTGVWVTTTGSDTTKPEFYNCSMSNQTTANFVVGNSYSDVTIDTCYFEEINTYGLLNIYSGASCYVRNSEFEVVDTGTYPANLTCVYGYGTNTNLGTSSPLAPGYNYFHSVVTVDDTLGLDYDTACCIKNISATYMEAYGDCFEDWVYPDASLPSPIIQGNVNYYANAAWRQSCWGDMFGKVLVSQDQITGLLPTEFSIEQNSPNPFNPSTTIKYNLPEASYIIIDIFNVLGERVKTLLNSYEEAGEHSIVWDGTDSGNQRVSSGIYFYRIEAGQFTQTKKMVLIK
ncbi:MAG: right-handed parallel beta-helix repeat-containing protein [Candidatus Zixiibacteriota bacterium]